MKRKIDREIFEYIISNDIDSFKKYLKNEADLNICDTNKRTLLINSVIENKIDFVKELIKLGADVNLQDEAGYSALHFAAQKHLLDIAKYLLDHNADVNLQDVYGNTPLSRAVFESKGRGEMIKLLLNYSADKDLKNYNGISAIDLAKKIANYNLLQFFK